MRDPRELAGAWARHQRHAFIAPAPDLGALVAHLWCVEWDYDEPYRQKIVPYPNVHVTVRPGERPRLQGVVTGHVERELVGRSRVVGAQLKVGVFRSSLGGPVGDVTDRVVDDWGPDGIDDVDAFQAHLRTVLRPPDAAGLEAAGIVDMIRTDPGLTRVDAVAAACGVGVRSLQRLFVEHVGVTPKWVVRRYRLHEVTERMGAPGVIDWAALAAELGYADQPHLVRDFTRMFGEPPTAYAARYAGR